MMKFYLFTPPILYTMWMDLRCNTRVEETDFCIEHEQAISDEYYIQTGQDIRRYKAR